MKIYQVGGCVRDKILGIQPKDYDFVVVGATPEQMLALGYKQVGASFPVFLNPQGQEYALARTERKQGVGYHGFAVDFNPNITLGDDLKRRDLTINSMAIDSDTGELIDPYGGQKDLHALVLRHTSEAFAEDPIRVLRTARFAARYSVFTVAPETIELMRKIAPELAHVPQERIWAEFEKGLMERQPDRMFDVLDQAKAFAVHALKPYQLADRKQLRRVLPSHDLVVRFTLAGVGFVDDDFHYHRIPVHCADVCSLFNRYYDEFCEYASYMRQQRLELLYAWRAFSGSSHLEKVMEILSLHRECQATLEKMLLDIAQAKTVDAAAVAASCTNGQEIKTRLFEARLTTL